MSDSTPTLERLKVAFWASITNANASMRWLDPDSTDEMIDAAWVGFEEPARAALDASGNDELVADAERAVRITVWNFLRERGVKQDDCYAIIEGAATSFRAAIARTQEQSDG